MNEEIKELRIGISDYARLKWNLAWLKSLKTSSNLWGKLVSMGMLTLMGMGILFFGSIALSFYIGSLIGNLAYAFGIVTGGWAFILIILLIFRESLLSRPLRNCFLRIISDNTNFYFEEKEDDKE